MGPCSPSILLCMLLPPGGAALHSVRLCMWLPGSAHAPLCSCCSSQLEGLSPSAPPHPILPVPQTLPGPYRLQSLPGPVLWKGLL